MTDTSPEMAALYRRLLLARSGAERMLMGFDMFDAARALARASLEAQEISAPRELRVALLLRTYGQELGPKTIDAFSTRSLAQ